MHSEALTMSIISSPTVACGKVKEVGKLPLQPSKLARSLRFGQACGAGSLNCIRPLQRVQHASDPSTRQLKSTRRLENGNKLSNVLMYTVGNSCYFVPVTREMSPLRLMANRHAAASGFLPIALHGTPKAQREAFRPSLDFGPAADLEDSVDEGGSGGETDLEDSDDDIDDEDVVQQTLDMFEWRQVCAQVAQFASTPMGISIAGQARLGIGSSQLQSEELLEQTADAGALPRPLDFSGVENLHGLIAEAMSGTMCDIEDLCSVKTTLIGIQAVRDQLERFTQEEAMRKKKRSSLQVLMSNCDLCTDLLTEIDHCLDCTRGTVLDRASPGLTAARRSRQENMEDLETLLKETASRVVQRGGIDTVLITRRRTRLCIAVRSSHKSLLPGGVTLDVSNSGTTSYMEPEPALILNNEENRLAAAEKAEEVAVLKRLTLKVVDKAHSIVDLLGRVTVVDLACARGSHARWLQSVCPKFYDALEDSSTSEAITKGFSKSQGQPQPQPLTVDICGLRHPILLGAVLPNLPSSQRCGALQSSVQSPTKVSFGPKYSGSEAAKLPVPIDIKVGSKIKVVTISGPNTGGKTATLKAFGVAAIMAKAGLFLPCAGEPRLPWFDMVLADVGDSQSLERNLSTFSGHIRRLCWILEMCTDRSFVLLDEVGGGTDPSEGAALATAILEHLCSIARLTVGTTHSAELKLLKERDSRFENASVEFDISSLKPTYRVLWGVAGQSNALDIAASLDFDQNVLIRARELVGKLRQSPLGIRATDILDPLMKQRDQLIERSKEAAVVLTKAQDLHLELKAAADNLPKREAAQRKLEERTVQDELASAKLKVDEVINRFQKAVDEGGRDDIASLSQEAHAEITSIGEEFEPSQKARSMDELIFRGRGLDQTPGEEDLAVGDKVLVRKLGKTPVTVVELPHKDTDILTVQLGTLKVQVKADDVLKIVKSEVAGTSGRAEKALPKIQTPVKNLKDGEDVDRDEQPKYDPAVRTSKNTLELRGRRVEDAVRELNMALASKRPQSVLFVVHGVGTGAVKEAVLQILRKHPFVAKFEEESITNAGCTIVYIK